jgi:hypothetical protein
MSWRRTAGEETPWKGTYWKSTNVVEVEPARVKRDTSTEEDDRGGRSGTKKDVRRISFKTSVPGTFDVRVTNPLSHTTHTLPFVGTHH